MAQLRVEIQGLAATQLALRNGLRAAVKEIATATHASLVAHTPVKSGNARRGWRTTVAGDTFTTQNRVPYIERLENNWSKQTRGQGIVKPAIQKIKGKLI